MVTLSRANGQIPVPSRSMVQELDLNPKGGNVSACWENETWKGRILILCHAMHFSLLEWSFSRVCAMDSSSFVLLFDIFGAPDESEVMLDFIPLQNQWKTPIRFLQHSTFEPYFSKNQTFPSQFSLLLCCKPCLGRVGVFAMLENASTEPKRRVHFRFQARDDCRASQEMCWFRREAGNKAGHSKPESWAPRIQ